MTESSKGNRSHQEPLHRLARRIDVTPKALGRMFDILVPVRNIPRHPVFGILARNAPGGSPVFGHCGGPEDVNPKSSGAAYDRLVEIGAHGGESDCQQTSDGVLFNIHDDTVQLPDGVHSVRELPSESVPTEYPTIESLIKWAVSNKKVLIIDPRRTSVTKLIVILEQEAAWDYVCLGAFSGRQLKKARKEAERVGGNLLIGMTPNQMLIAYLMSFLNYMPRFAQVAQAPFRLSMLHSRFSKFPIRLGREHFVNVARRFGIEIWYWIPNSDADITEAVRQGAGLITDRPLRALNSRAESLKIDAQ
jgi:glycerophosphoryl diester phosphodiesterase